MPRATYRCIMCGQVRRKDPAKLTRVCQVCRSGDTRVRIVRREYSAPGEWAVDAACTQVDPELFYPPDGHHGQEAKAVCAECPVRVQCLEWALRIRDRYAVLGGMSPGERAVLQRGRGQGS